MEKQLKWYALYTRPRAEKRVRKRLREAEVENYLPLHRCPSAWSDRVKMINKPLFQSYIFVRCPAHQLPELLKIYGVVKIVYYCGKPAVIRQKEIDAIVEFLKLAVEKPLCVGDEAEILSGSLKTVAGKVQLIKKKYIKLYIKQIGAIVSVNIANVAHADRLKL
ncbi:MAG: UpxY family transcription antiterminator [Tannerella sp.]|jgi:transcription antitermination factor NusG|nr:UpxY family transcription antiterminator [Tannerella sp.]